jgi:hypothetical protein
MMVPNIKCGPKYNTKEKNIMENKKKKGFFDMLISKKDKGCCCDFELEEVQEEKTDIKDFNKTNNSKDPAASEKEPRFK